jgi:hypothetical protein
MRTSSLALVAFALSGCGSSPDPCIADPSLCTCSGQCTTTPDAQFVVMLWSGPEGTTPPSCPAAAFNGDNGFLDTPPSTITCDPPCGCSPSNVYCYLPEMDVADSAACPAGGAGVPFNAPSLWDGTCTAMDPVASADSVTFSPPVLTGADMCQPSSSSTVQFKDGTTIALVCNSLDPQGLVPGTCATSDLICTYPNAPGFTLCGYNQGDVPCTGPWTNKHLLFEDSAACECSCGPPANELCTATYTAYEDSSCSEALGSVPVTSNQSAMCVDVPAGSALGSKSASLDYKPGICTPMLTTALVATLCCM